MDEQAFDAFYSSSFAPIVSQVAAMCGSRTEAQDCVQEAFIRAWDHRRDLDRASSPEGWVRTVATRLAVSRWRHRSLDSRAGDRSVAPTPPREPSPDRVALQRAMATLPFEQRQALVLYHTADLDIGTIAAELRTNPNTVKTRLARGRAALAKLLAEPDEEASHVR